MNREVILDKLTDIFREIFNNQGLSIGLETTANDVEGWDSLTHIILVDTVENAFSIKFDMDEVFEMKNVGDMVEAICALVGGV